MKNKYKFAIQHLIALIIFIPIAYFMGCTPFPGDNMAVINDPNQHGGYGFLSWFYCILIIALCITWLVYTLWGIDEAEHRVDRNEDWYEKHLLFNSKNAKMKFKWWLAIILIVVVYVGFKAADKMSTVYNTSVVYNKQYDQKITERMGFYDKLWKTFLAKEKITNLNRETFMEVAKIQMENRKDGPQVTWKWLQENSPIPYNEFTKFYSDMSDFIETQRQGYYDLETKMYNLKILVEEERDIRQSP